MKNIKFAKIVKNIFILLMISILSMTLIACRQDSDLPKPIGKKISLTAAQLDDKLSKLSLELEPESILYTKASYEYISGAIDNYRTSIGHSEATYNHSNMDTWLSASNKVTFEEAVYEAKINGFQSSTATYIDLTDSLNQPFSEDYSYMSNHVDGKYKLFRSYEIWSPNSTTLTDIYLSLGLDMIISNKFEFDGNVLDLVKNLHRLNFSGLSFYEYGTNFSITLDFKVAKYDEYSTAVIEYIKEYYSLDESYQQYMDYKLVLNFKDNSLVEMGHIRNSGYQIDDSYFAEIELKIYQNIIDSLPSEIIYADYQMIESLEDIKS